MSDILVFQGSEIHRWTAEADPQWIAPLHRHLTEDEGWFVLDGALEILVGDQRRVIQAREGFVVPAGTVHTFRNAAQTATEYLIMMGPQTARLVRAIHSSDDRSLDSMVELFARFQSEFLGCPTGD